MLVKLPKEVSKIMTRLQDAGFEAYVVGECIKDSFLGQKPFGWDLATNAGMPQLKEFFPEAEVLSEKFSVLRFEYIEEIVDKDGEVEGETGIIVDLGTYRQGDNLLTDGSKEVVFAAKVEDDLARRDFTINAIAENQTELVDPYDGKEDIRKKLIKTVGEADKSFKEDPIRMFRAVRIAAELDFDLHKPVYDAIVANKDLLGTVSPGRLRDEFSMMVTAAHAGKGLSMLMDTGMISAILGQKVVDSLTRREMQDLTVLSQNIDKTQPVEARRLGLFFTCIAKNKAKPAIERLNFDETTNQHLIDAINDMPKLYFAATPPVLKKFIYERGWERYEYLASLEKAQRIIFDYFSETKIRSKIYMIEQIKLNGEAIFPEDLKIDANDLVSANICKRENAEKILKMLTEEVHTHPKKNNREQLLKLAKVYSKNKLAAALRGIHWSR